MYPLSTIILAGMLACIMLGAIYLRIWFHDRPRLALLFFSLTAISLVFYAAGELSMMHAAATSDFVRAIYWAHIPTWASHVTFLLFVWFYLNAGRTWLLGTAIGLRTLATIISLFSPFSINFTEITGLRTINFYGESLAIAVGTRNPLMTIGHIATLIALVYCIDAAIVVWRRGERQLARWFGFSVVIFIGARLADTVLVMWGVIDFPLTASPFFMGIVFAMGWQLSTAPKREQQLARQLEERSDESAKWHSAMDLASDAGTVGVWIRDVNTGTIWANNAYRTIFGFSADEVITMESVLERVHSDNRETYILDLEKSFLEADEVNQEYQLSLPDGTVRWIRTRKRLDRTQRGQPMVYGAAADITDQRLAEEKAHDLSGKMITVLETERSRLARELHDDLSQSLALLSIELASLNRSDIGTLEDRIRGLADRVNTISADVHRMSYELHPARLEQLGLASAIRGFCREIGETQGLAIDLTIGKLPLQLSKDVTLCIYRIIQEAVQNVVKHSGARKATVEVGVSGSDLVLIILDTGAGFDPNDARITASLGLISMRERIMAVGGTLRLNSRVGDGTVVEARITLSAEMLSSATSDEIIQVSASSH